LPRLALDRPGDEGFFRGTLSMASAAIELGRLRQLKSAPDMPPNAARAIEHFLGRFADALQGIAGNDANHRIRIAEAEAIVTDMRAELSAQALEPGKPARSVLRAAASLRFINDRFTIDRAYLERNFAEN
jgi:hypothetical protein